MMPCQQGLPGWCNGKRFICIMIVESQKNEAYPHSSKIPSCPVPAKINFSGVYNVSLPKGIRIERSLRVALSPLSPVPGPQRSILV